MNKLCKQVVCECADPGCPAHKGMSDCLNMSHEILYRVDMHDETGTAMCEHCADDAFSSGLFAIKEGR